MHFNYMGKKKVSMDIYCRGLRKGKRVSFPIIKEIIIYIEFLSNAMHFFFLYAEIEFRGPNIHIN